MCYRFLAGRNQILTEALLGGARVLEENPTPCGPVATTEHAVALANSELNLLSGPEASAIVDSAPRTCPERHYRHHPHRPGAGDDPEVN